MTEDLRKPLARRQLIRRLIATGEIHGARARMTGTEEFPGLIDFAARMFRTGDFYPNPGSILCHPKYCARWSRCPYRD